MGEYRFSLLPDQPDREPALTAATRFKIAESDTPFLIGAAIGSGSTGLAAARGGADFLLAINAGRLRSMGAPSIACMLPIFDATSLTEAFARDELLPQCDIPVLLGVDVWGGALDPARRASEIAAAGFAGAVNFPSCMHYPRPMQQLLSRTGRGIEREVAQLRAVQDAGLTSMFYCATRTQARLAADAGIDMVCLNLGWNVGGAVGHRRRASIEEVATAVREIGRLIKRINPRIRFLLEGGPIATAEDLGQLLRLAPIDGYVGGSTFERMPLEASVADQIDRFRHAGRRVETLNDESAGLLAWGRRFGLTGRAKAQLAYLERLRPLSSVSAPVLIHIGQGQDPMPTLRALASRTAGTPVLFQIDLAGEDFPARARAMMFGHADPAARRRPALGDPEIDLLIIHAPERLPNGAQRRLARALSDGVFRATGQRRPNSVAPRVALVRDGAHADSRDSDALDGLDPALSTLFAGTVLRPPPLAARIDDLMGLIEGLSEDRLGRPLHREAFSAEAMQALEAHPWPGNEAELQTILGKLRHPGSGQPIQRAELAPLLHGNSDRPATGRSEKDRIVDALWRHGFSRGKTAEALGISRKTLYNKIRKYGLAD